jgi:hypothetical protein
MRKSARVAGWRCFQGDSLGGVFPGLKPMGCSVFALRAMQNVPNQDATTRRAEASAKAQARANLEQRLRHFDFVARLQRDIQAWVCPDFFDIDSDYFGTSKQTHPSLIGIRRETTGWS